MRALVADREHLPLAVGLPLHLRCARGGAVRQVRSVAPSTLLVARKPDFIEQSNPKQMN